MVLGNYFDLKHGPEVNGLLRVFKSDLDEILAVFAWLSVPIRKDLEHYLVRFSHNQQGSYFISDHSPVKTLALNVQSCMELA